MPTEMNQIKIMGKSVGKSVGKSRQPHSLAVKYKKMPTKYPRKMPTK